MKVVGTQTICNKAHTYQLVNKISKQNKILGKQIAYYYSPIVNVRNLHIIQAARQEVNVDDKEDIQSDFNPETYFENDEDLDMDDEVDENGDIKVDIKELEQDQSLMLKNCNLSQEILDSLAKRGIERLFPIQKAVFDPIRQGNDIIGRAKTGSGKTLAFALPIIENILQDQKKQGAQRGRHPKAIIIVPTRELAKQVESEVISCQRSLSICVCYGGTPEYTQVRQLQGGVDIVVGTPGRLMDLMSDSRGKQRQQCLFLDSIEHVILDESDQMLDMGFQEDIEMILKNIPKQNDVQTLLFSATLPSWIRNIARKFQKNPKVIDLVGEENTGKLPDTITALAMECQLDNKPTILRDIIQVYAKDGKVIVFVNTKRECDVVFQLLSVNYRCGILHGDKSQNDRDRAMKNFKSGNIQLLVATDVAARGLDIPNVELVIHYELPNDGEGYLHRSGRTGRAGKDGVSIMLVTGDELREFKRIVKETDTDIHLAPLPGPEEVIKSAASQVYKTLANVNVEVAKYFAEPAQKMLEVGEPTMVLATALAALSGHTDLPKKRSLLSQEEGSVTLKLEGKNLYNSKNVVGFVAGCVSSSVAGEIGKISIYREEDSDVNVAVFDVPQEVEQQITSHKEKMSEQGVILSQPKTLPIEVSQSLSSFQNRGDSRGGRSGRGGRGGRGGGGGGRYNNYDSPQSSGGYGRGGGGRGGGSSYGRGGGSSYGRGSMQQSGGLRQTGGYAGSRDNFGDNYESKYSSRDYSSGSREYQSGGRGSYGDQSSGGGGRGGGQRSYGDKYSQRGRTR